VIPTRHVTHIQKKKNPRPEKEEWRAAVLTHAAQNCCCSLRPPPSRAPYSFTSALLFLKEKKTAGHRVIYSSLFEIRRVTRGKKSVATRTEISCFSICGSFLSSLSCFAHAPHGTSSTSPLMFRDYASLPYSGFVFVFRSFLPFLLVGRLYASSEASGLQRTKRRT